MDSDGNAGYVDNFAQLPTKRARLGRQFAASSKISGVIPKVARVLTNAMQTQINSLANEDVNYFQMDHDDQANLDIEGEELEMEEGAEDDAFHFKVNTNS